MRALVIAPVTGSIRLGGEALKYGARCKGLRNFSSQNLFIKVQQAIDIRTIVPHGQIQSNIAYIVAVCITLVQKLVDVNHVSTV